MRQTRRPMRSLALIAVSMFAACGVADVSGAATSTDAIVGGQLAPDDDAVYMLYLRGDDGAASLCTATLIAPRTLLTAAHCADPRILGSSSVRITATNAADESTVQFGVNTVRVTETRLHPSWNAATLANDIALLLLERPQPVTPKAWNTATLEGRGGQLVRAVGYGTIGNGQASGVRRQVELTLRQFNIVILSLGDFTSRGICHGDSGGPTFMTFDDGVERVIGVHSFTRSESCTDGADTRVDSYTTFITQWLADREDECATNNLCAQGACAVPDADCVAPGGACSSELQCVGRVCTDDAQHAQTYCSTTCTDDDDCAAGFSCDVARGVCQHVQLPTVPPGAACTPGAQFCIRGSVCTGPAGNLRCRVPCGMTSDCPNPERCLAGVDGVRVCTAPPPISLLALGEAQGPNAGCSTGSEVLTFLLLLLFQRRHQR